MTTVAEVKRWVQPMLAEHPDLALRPRLLYLSPIRHIYRTIHFVGSSDRTFSKPTASYRLLFGPPSAPPSNNWDLQLSVGWSSDADFHDALARVVRETLDHPMRALSSIEGLYALMGGGGLIWGNRTYRLSSAPILHASVLAALGRLSEAHAIMRGYIDENETHLLGRLAEGEAIREQRPKSGEARLIIDVASRLLRPMNELKQFTVVTGANDREAVAALLRKWEHQRVTSLGIDQDWEPTPFPLEQD